MLKNYMQYFCINPPPQGAWVLPPLPVYVYLELYLLNIMRTGITKYMMWNTQHDFLL